MMQSPFAFFRGAAAIRAGDLAHTPRSSIAVQVCGDCHLMNFGLFATPERRLIFDISDFRRDRTRPVGMGRQSAGGEASWIAAQHIRFSKRDARDVAERLARSLSAARPPIFPRCACSNAGTKRLDADELIGQIPLEEMEKAGPETHCQGNGTIDRRARFSEARVHEERTGADQGQPAAHLSSDRRWREGLRPDGQKRLPAVLRDPGGRIAGACWSISKSRTSRRRSSESAASARTAPVLLLMAGDDDPLFLQVKEARRSVLEPYAGKSIYRNQGQRVVAGQRLMQAASDLFLGWTTGEAGMHFYVRQLRDIKISPVIEIMTPKADEHVCRRLRLGARARACEVG
jgi:hypothetical protein